VLFHERLEQALALSRRGQESCLMCIDLDAFKAVNDNFGHPIGDALLKAVASRLLACVREVDTVTRLGGDEFAILLSSPNPIGDIADLAERIIGRLSEPFILEGHRVGIGASMGIAVTPDNGITAEVLLKSADTALCRGKQDRPGTFRFFQPAMHERLQARLQLERDLAAALQADEFNLLYQPIVDLATNRISGFEALLRWHHATRGLVQPAEFIPLAEETGLIVAIGAWVLRRACVDAATWPEPVTVAVNLSVAQLRSSDLVATVRQALADAAIPANRLELEITESVLIGQCRETLDSLHAVRNLGVSFALDDFGTGYSSLSTLHSFPFDRIKIDRSFIRDLTERADSAAIIRAVVGLGHGMGIATVAEGIEYQDQLLQVRQEGCTQAQGFLFSPPISCADAVQMLRSFQPAQLPAVWRSPLKLT
jgi:diguanylate cyclase (GGDEF)-like protein